MSDTSKEKKQVHVPKNVRITTDFGNSLAQIFEKPTTRNIQVEEVSASEQFSSGSEHHDIDVMLLGAPSLEEALSQSKEQPAQLSQEISEVVHQHFEQQEEPLSIESAIQKQHSVAAESVDEELERLLPVSPNASELSWDRFEQLAKRGSWDELSYVSTDDSDSHPDEAKLWWIYSQEQIGTLSVLLLAAPLKELIESVANNDEHPLRAAPKMKRLEELTQLHVAELLKQDDGLIEAYTLLEAMHAVTHSHSSFQSEWQGIWTILSNREPYSLSLVEKSILEEASNRVMTPAEPEKAKPEKKESTGVDIAQLAEQQSLHHDRSRFYRSALFILALITFGVGFSYLVMPLFTETEVVEKRVVHTEIPQFQATLILPAYSTIGPGRLSGLLLDAAIEAELKAEKVQPDEKEEVVEKEPEATEVAKEERPPVVTKVVLDMSGPIEPSGLTALVEQEVEQYDEVREIGEDFVRGVGRDMSDPNYRAHARIGAKYTPQVYETIVDTVVLKEPSYESAVLERVKRGSSVRVIERVGAWLRLSSQDGKFGYILKQDAVRKRRRPS